MLQEHIELVVVSSNTDEKSLHMRAELIIKPGKLSIIRILRQRIFEKIRAQSVVDADS